MVHEVQNMVIDPKSVLPQLLAPAVAWAQLQSRQVQQEGVGAESRGSCAREKGQGSSNRTKSVSRLLISCHFPRSRFYDKPRSRQDCLAPAWLGLRSDTVFWSFVAIWGHGFCRMNYDMYINMRFIAPFQGSCPSIWSKSPRWVITTHRLKRMHVPTK